MNTLTWVLVGLAVYWLVVAALQARGLFPDNVNVRGPILSIHTKRGLKLLEWLARPARFWRAWSNFGLGVTLVLMVGAFLLMPMTAYSALTERAGDAVTQPQNLLVIPGVNEFIPLSVAPEVVVGLLVGLVVHEFGHGILSRVGDIDVESMGIILATVVPIAAFVLPDEESQREADRGDQARMFAAGVTNNFAISLVAIALLFGPVAGAVTVLPGLPVGDAIDHLPAADAGLESGDRILAVAGENVSNADQLDALLRANDDPEVAITLADGRETTVSRALYLTRTTPDIADRLSIGSVPPRVTAVEGQEVTTRADLYDALAEDPEATVTTTNGSFELVAGASVSRLAPGGPMASQTDLPLDRPFVITRLAGERVVTDRDLSEIRNGTGPGETVAIELVLDGERRTTNVTLGDDGDRGRLGIFIQQGTGGVAVDDFGVDAYPADQFLTALAGGTTGGGIGGLAALPFVLLLLPITSVVSPTPYNFAGFAGLNTAFYTAPGLPDALVFVAANVLLWTAWININLGFFNCIPAFPLDGGHVLRNVTEAVASRLPMEHNRRVVRAVTTTSALVMLGSLVLLVVGPELLR